jgi:hypothetical protein
MPGPVAAKVIYVVDVLVLFVRLRPKRAGAGPKHTICEDS